jgi:uncharacterized protein
MPNINSYKSGSFCWLELGTTDQNAAKKFYGSLFGWGVFDAPMGPSDFYTMFQIGGRDAAAAYTLTPEHRAHGVPPHWMLYVAVESADAAASRVKELGGKVLKEAFDVFDVGRMAVVEDPAGAHFCVWQAKKAANGIAGVDGTLCWADLNTPDQAGAKIFYTNLFGWKMVEDTDDDPPSGYVHIQNEKDFIGGIIPPKFYNPRTPPCWMPYIQVSNCDGSAEKVQQLGGKLYMPPQTLEDAGRFAIVADPQGAGFAIFQPKERK